MAASVKPFLNDELPVLTNTRTDSEAPKIEEFSAPSKDTNIDNIQSDVIVIGAGFSGITAIDRLRKQNMTVKCFESGGDFGGVWYWNRYPGARVDSELPYYQLNIPEVYETWNFSERFPGHEELRRYMAHIDKTLGLRKDTYFDARVIDSSWDEASNKWTIKTEQGHVASAKYLILATGLLHRAYTPDFPGLKDYKGEVYHSGAWKEDFDARGKRIGLIGAGATAVQITQELGKLADELTVFLRRPSYCLPMGQRKLADAEQIQMKEYLPTLFKAGRDSPAGFPVAKKRCGAQEVSEEERESTFDRIWAAGGFQFNVFSYSDVLINPESNKIVYDYWRKRVCQRLTDPAKQKILAPEKMPYYYNTRRMPLEQDYYEVVNQSNVSVHDLGAVPLKHFAEKGMVMADGKLHEFDCVVLATGFDSFTGSLTNLGLKNKEGTPLKEIWEQGVSTYLGLTMNGFPNLFIAYSPQAPTALSNGTTIIECQIETIVDMIKKLESENVRVIEAKREAEVEWKTMLAGMVEHTLYPFTDSWWNGSNIPGKKAENQLYVAGINGYEADCRAKMVDWKGFNITAAEKA